MSPRKVSDANAIFKDKTSRDDYRSYMAHDQKRPQVAPNEYF